jgi:hypothetical protein
MAAHRTAALKFRFRRFVVQADKSRISQILFQRSPSEEGLRFVF